MFPCQVLLRDTHHFVALLQEIQALASEAEQAESEEAVQRVIEHVDRIAAWGGARQRAWSEYYQYVHRYLRDVVRLDPDRALSQRLRERVASWPSTPFHLLVAAAPSIRLLRPLESRVDCTDGWPSKEIPVTGSGTEPRLQADSPHYPTVTGPSGP